MSENKEISYDNFVQILQGHSAFQLMWAGIQFKVFDILFDKPNRYSINELKEELKLDVNPSKILFDGLLTLGLIIIDEQKLTLSNSKIIDKYLVSKSPVNLIGMAGWQHHIVYPAAIDFTDSLKENRNIGLRHFPGNGDTLYQRLSTNPDLEKVFQDAMQSISNAANYHLIDYLDLTSFHHMMDFGGGNGTNSIKFAKKNPHLKVTIHDIPTVCERAFQNVSNNNLTNRISILPGDFFITEYPRDIDCVLYSHIVTIWSPEKNIELLKRIYNALPLNGQVFVFSTMGNNNGIGPMLTAVGSVYFQTVATGEGMLYSKKEIMDFVSKAGFLTSIKEDLPFDHTLVIGTKTL